MYSICMRKSVRFLVLTDSIILLLSEPVIWDRHWANYVKFEKRGFVITGLFDVNPALAGLSVRGIEIHMMDELPEFLKTQRVDIAVLTLPKEKAEQAAEKLVELGIHAIWNFAHLDLELPDDVVVENVHLSDSLMQLSYNIVRRQDDK